MSRENSEIDHMLSALDQETLEDKHEQVDNILNEVHDQIQALHELHQDLRGEE